MATLSTLVDRVRVELGDLGKSFVTQFVADGTTNRFKLHYAPLDGTGVRVFQNGIDVSDLTSVEESTGVLVFDTVPADGDEISVSGYYYRYFTQTEVERLVNDAVLQHTANHTDSLGRKVNIENLPGIEEYPVAIYATTLALYTLATDSAFDIDVQAPDGVTIPRTERFRQLMEMVQTRQQQYRELCTQLGIGMYKIDVFSLRRISKATGRYVPVYKPQEVDDRSYPDRIDIPTPTYGDTPLEWPTQSVELTSYQGRPFTTDVSFEAPTGATLVAKLLNQRGSVVMVQQFTSEFIEDEETPGQWTGTMSLTGDQTLRLAGRTYWSIQVVEDGDTVIEAEVKGGNFFTVRASTVVL
jgi:hypothetical protein